MILLFPCFRSLQHWNSPTSEFYNERYFQCSVAAESFYRERYIQASKEHEQLRKKLQSQAELEIEQLTSQKRLLERKVNTPI